METTGFLTHFLNGMEPDFFFPMYIFAFFGMLSFFTASVLKAIKEDPTTPNKFKLKWVFIKGGLRLFLCLVIMFFGVTYFPQYMKFILSFGGSEIPVGYEPEINGFSAFFIVGMFADTIAKKLAGFGKDGFKQVVTLVNGKK